MDAVIAVLLLLLLLLLLVLQRRDIAQGVGLEEVQKVLQLGVSNHPLPSLTLQLSHFNESLPLQYLSLKVCARVCACTGVFVCVCVRVCVVACTRVYHV
jgi:H+/Cl- antiporter ClcA